MISQSPILESQYETSEKYEEALLLAKQIVETSLRQKRDLLLSASDWTQGNDSPLSTELKTAWSAYRQALRDLPISLELNYQSGFTIDENSFPVKPE